MSNNLSEYLSYDPNTGLLKWLPRDHQKHKNWNTRWAGKEAMTATHKKGYLCGNFMRKLFLAHRACWEIYYGAPPKNQIDHINGNKKDNRICNLREVENRENHLNMPIRSDNKSGHHGVAWDNRYSMWCATIKANDKKVHLGYFHEKQDAVKARKIAESFYGYHENHGRLSGN